MSTRSLCRENELWNTGHAVCEAVIPRPITKDAGMSPAWDLRYISPMIYTYCYINTFLIRRTSGRNIGTFERKHVDITRYSSLYANLVIKVFMCRLGELTNSSFHSGTHKNMGTISGTGDRDKSKWLLAYLRLGFSTTTHPWMCEMLQVILRSCEVYWWVLLVRSLNLLQPTGYVMNQQV